MSMDDTFKKLMESWNFSEAETQFVRELHEDPATVRDRQANALSSLCQIKSNEKYSGKLLEATKGLVWATRLLVVVAGIDLIVNIVRVLD